MRRRRATAAAAGVPRRQSVQSPGVLLLSSSSSRVSVPGAGLGRERAADYGGETTASALGVTHVNGESERRESESASETREEREFGCVCEGENGFSFWSVVRRELTASMVWCVCDAGMHVLGPAFPLHAASPLLSLSSSLEAEESE